jgi:hypothetical protein
MLKLGKAADALTVDDLKCHPKWRFVNDDAVGETIDKPIKRLPVTILRGEICRRRSSAIERVPRLYTARQP